MKWEIHSTIIPRFQIFSPERTQLQHPKFGLWNWKRLEVFETY